MSALAFTVLALALTGPVPSVLARASWPLRAPRAAVVLWQSVALAAVLSAFSAGLSFVVLLSRSGADALGRPLALVALVVFVLTLVIGARLAAAAAAVAVGTRRRRARHRKIVDLVGTCRHDNVRVLRAREPLAYCLPGMRGRVVLSEGALRALSESELAAILRHERTHLRARHDLVLEAFIALHEAFPRMVRSGSALAAVRLLVELLADDAAVRATGPAPLARALVACASARVPAGALAAGGGTTVVRVRRLAGPPNSRLLALSAYLAAAAILVVPTVAVAVPWLTEIHRLFLA